MVAFSTIKAGDILWQKVRQKMGNTSMSQDVVYQVTIEEVHEDYAMARWNGNPATRWYERQITKLSRKKPERKPNIFEKAAAARAART
jgi:hypothetical protein